MARQEAPHPASSAMLMCDFAIREEGTGKVNLIGIFDTIFATQFPVVHPRLSVYVRLTDAEGEYEFKLEMVRLEDEKAVGEGRVQATIGDRMGSHELIFNLGNLVFERPGRYEFRLFGNQKYIGRAVFRVVQKS